jgi:hypothetical protein
MLIAQFYRACPAFGLIMGAEWTEQHRIKYFSRWYLVFSQLDDSIIVAIKERKRLWGEI